MRVKEDTLWNDSEFQWRETDTEEDPEESSSWNTAKLHKNSQVYSIPVLCKIMRRKWHKIALNQNFVILGWPT